MKQPLLTLTLAVAASSLLQAQAVTPGKSQSLSPSEQVPAGLSAADWQGIRRAAATGVTSQQAYLKASNTGADDSFGTAVAVSGDTVVVGAMNEDSSTRGTNSSPNEGAVNAGAVYIFTRSSSGIWSQQAYLKAGNSGAGDNFGSSVAISGETVVVGASREDSSSMGVNSAPNETTTDAGAAYVFTRSGGIWSQQAYLKASNPGKDDHFGQAVSVSGETVVIGAPLEDSNAVGVNNNQVNNLAVESGAAYVFTRSGSSWSQQVYLKASNTGADDTFGYSVAVSGETVVVGAQSEDSNAVGVNADATAQADNSAALSGAVYVFTRSGGSWSQQAYLKASNAAEGDLFGAAVALSGETVVVGAQLEDSATAGVNSSPNEAAKNSGAAYVFSRSGGIWSQQAYLKASNPGLNDSFGISLAIAGETVVIGANPEDSATSGVNSSPNEGALNAGAAYVFTRSGSAWSQQSYLKASNTGAGDGFGYSVAVSGNTVISGAALEDSITTGINSITNDAGTADDAGAVYIFTLPVAEPPVVVKYLVRVKLSQVRFGQVTGSGSFTTGSKVTLRAKAKRDHKFRGWYEKNKLISKKPVLVITSLTKNRTLVAKFK
jgi:FG-GAP repeat/Divergent InlB B-repeat domain